MSFSAASLHAVLKAHVPRGATGWVVALSGGRDSAALLAAMKDYRDLPLRAVHVDHGLQEAAAQFRQACMSQCEHLGIPLTVLSVAVDTEEGASIEAAARDARYAALAAQLAPNECLLTAHHRQDQAETLLLQALRGAGAKGLSAMPFCRVLGKGWHVRPLLEVAQGELLQFGAALPEFAASDPMNGDLRFDRSFLRHQVWPLIKTRWPGADIALARSARHLADAQQLLEATAAADLAFLRDGDALQIPRLRSLAPLRRMNVLRFWLAAAQVEPPSTARLSESLRQVLEAEVDQLPAIVWGDKALRRYRDRLFLTEAHPPCLAGAQPWDFSRRPRLELGPDLGSLSWVAKTGGIALGMLPPVLIVRRRAGGESLKPAPLAKTHSVQHLCQSQGVLPWMRDALPLVFAGDALIAVADLWLDAHWCAAADAPGFALKWQQAPIYT